MQKNNNLSIEHKYFEILEQFSRDQCMDLMDFFNNMYELDPEWVSDKISFIYDNGKTEKEIYENIVDQEIKLIKNLNKKNLLLENDIIENIEIEVREIECKKGRKQVSFVNGLKFCLNGRIREFYDKLIQFYSHLGLHPDDEKNIKIQFTEMNNVFDKLTVYHRFCQLREESKNHVKEHNSLTEEIKEILDFLSRSEADLMEYQSKYDLDELSTIRMHMVSRVTKIEEYLKSNKSIWESFMGIVEYIPCMTNSTDFSKTNIIEYKANVISGDIIGYYLPKEVNFEPLYDKFLKDRIKNDQYRGYLVALRSGSIPENSRKMIVEYFMMLEEISILKAYMLPDIELNKALKEKTYKLKSELERLEESTADRNQEMSKLIKQFDNTYRRESLSSILNGETDFVTFKEIAQIELRLIYGVMQIFGIDFIKAMSTEKIDYNRLFQVLDKANKDIKVQYEAFNTLLGNPMDKDSMVKQLNEYLKGYPYKMVESVEEPLGRIVDKLSLGNYRIEEDIDYLKYKYRSMTPRNMFSIELINTIEEFCKNIINNSKSKPIHDYWVNTKSRTIKRIIQDVFPMYIIAKALNEIQERVNDETTKYFIVLREDIKKYSNAIDYYGFIGYLNDMENKYSKKGE